MGITASTQEALGEAAELPDALVDERPAELAETAGQPRADARRAAEHRHDLRRHEVRRQHVERRRQRRRLLPALGARAARGRSRALLLLLVVVAAEEVAADLHRALDRLADPVSPAHGVYPPAPLRLHSQCQRQWRAR